MSRVPVIAIDGPGASGKTVVGLGLARRLGYQFVDTGTMYRAVTWLALERHIPLDDQEALGSLASGISIEFSGGNAGNGLPKLHVDGRDLSDEIRTPAVDRAVSQVSMAPGVRDAMVRLQRSMAARGRVVMVGRDIGTVVLPEADLKLFLLASTEERARRRYAELRERGEAVHKAGVQEELKRRDKLDMERSLSPLTPAKDAKQIVTDNLTIEKVVDLIWQLTEKP